MTILITPFSDKKGDKLIVPLVSADQLALSTEAAKKEAEAQNGNIVFLNARARRVSNSTVLGLLFAALIVVSIGIISGLYFYRQFIHQKFIHRQYINIPRYNGTLRIGSQNAYVSDSELPFYQKLMGNRFSNNELQEALEIDLVNEFEKIDVPDFSDGRKGRFIHDFNSNTTGIIDVTARRCFVMPLNRGHVLPPKTLYDLIVKMWDGYYKVDTQVVKETMHVVLPPIKDTRSIGNYIAEECEGMPIYKLEKYVGRVVKRSAELKSEAKFAQFSGKGITEIDIINFSDVEKFEKSGH